MDADVLATDDTDYHGLRHRVRFSIREHPRNPWHKTFLLRSIRTISPVKSNFKIKVIATIVLQWLEDSSWAVAIRQSAWMYPVLEIIHIIGIVVLVGPAFMFDLRLLGVSGNLPAHDLAKHLLTWSGRGLLAVIPSGLLLFITNAETLGRDALFWIKMGLLVVAALNALVFHRITYRSVRLQTEVAGTKLPRGAKPAAIISIIVWLATITCGRLLAY